MANEQLIEAAILIAIVLVIIAIPYFCCQVTNEEYRRITTGIQNIKLDQLIKQAETEESRTTQEEEASRKPSPQKKED